MNTIDLVRENAALFAARAGVVEVEAGPAVFLAVEGEGSPDLPAHTSAISRLFALAWAAKLALEYNGELAYEVPPLECLWLSDPSVAPEAPWQWRLLLRLPEAVTEARLAGPRRYVADRKGLDTADVRRIRFTEGRAVQTLHIGPYGEEAAAYARLDAYAEANALRLRGPGHDIYLNDPERVAPEKLKTLIRLAVSPRR